MKIFKLIFIINLLLTQSCSQFINKGKSGPGWYLVKPTDTLYSLAWRYNIDFKSLVRWNQLKTPYEIKPGSYIRLIEPRNPIVQSPEKVKVTAIAKPTKIPLKKIQKVPKKWIWPVRGKILNRFKFNDINKRGIDIASNIRQSVKSIGAGKVVYSGNGLVGYKNLIIIKHNETYLSAYAQNKNIKVKEGDAVKKGQEIAEMGKHFEKGYLLHFQIRKNGKPVNPLPHLPK